MKKILSILLLAIIVSSCSSSVLMLQGNYPKVRHYKETSKTTDEVWANIVDWFFETETPISLIDKESGIIVSGRIPLRLNTVEESNGQPAHSSAYCVVGEEPNLDVVGFVSSITGTMMARVRQNGDKTFVQVTLSDLECRSSSFQYIEIKSTGRFEQQWLKYITSK